MEGKCPGTKIKASEAIIQHFDHSTLTRMLLAPLLVLLLLLLLTRRVRVFLLPKLVKNMDARGMQAYDFLQSKNRWLVEALARREALALWKEAQAHEVALGCQGALVLEHESLGTQQSNQATRSRDWTLQQARKSSRKRYIK